MPTSYEIHPAIGIARLGSSDEYFFGPEPDLQSVTHGRYSRSKLPWDFRDSEGRLKRQAARFRVFECVRDGQGNLTQAPRELTADDADITWSVHLTNRKGAVDKFRQPGHRRNPHVAINQ